MPPQCLFFSVILPQLIIFYKIAAKTRVFLINSYEKDKTILPVEIQKAAERSAGLTARLPAFARKQAVEPRPPDLNEKTGGMIEEGVFILKPFAMA